MCFTLFQTTHFRLFQIQWVSRRQFQVWWKWQKFLQMVRKHCGKRRNCSSRAISPFPIVFSKGLTLQTRKNQGLFGKGLRRFSTFFHLYMLSRNSFYQCSTQFLNSLSKPQLLSLTNIIKTIHSSETGMNPVVTVIINPQREYRQSRRLNHAAIWSFSLFFSHILCLTYYNVPITHLFSPCKTLIDWHFMPFSTVFQS